MPPPENLHVKTQRAWIRERMAQGISDGVEMGWLPTWILDIYHKHGPYDRGVLLGVLLEEWLGGEDAEAR